METRNKNPFFAASICCGVFAILTISALVPSIFFGSFAIIFAILSKGKEPHFTKGNGMSLILGIASVTISLVCIFIPVYKYNTDSEYHATVNKEYQDIMGISLDDFIQLVDRVADGDQEAVEEYNKLQNKLFFRETATPSEFLFNNTNVSDTASDI